MEKYSPNKPNYIDDLLDKELNEPLAKTMLPQGDTNNAATVHKYLKENYPLDTLTWVKDAEWALKDVPLSMVKMARRPGGAREQDKVKGIAKAVKDGEKMEPVVLVKTPDAHSFKIADGYHRTLGFEHAGKSTIKAWVGEVKESTGPWDKEMHERKLNVGKKASPDEMHLPKEASLPATAMKLGKGLATTALNAGKSLSGYNVLKAKKQLKNTKNNPLATTKDVKAANRKALKSQLGMAGSWGMVGSGIAGQKIADKYTEERKKQIKTPEPPKVPEPNVTSFS